MDAKVKYLLSLNAVRDRAQKVGQAAEAGKLSHFDVHEERLGDVAEFVTSVITRDFGPDNYHTIPPHGRWQHFETGGIPRIASLLSEWRAADGGGVDDREITRRLVDLFFVSVLLDAGAGDQWRFKEPGTERVYERSEGIAVASLWMFKGLVFTVGKEAGGMVVDGKGLEGLKTQTLAEYFQITETNPILGLESRAELLRGLGTSLLSQPEVFGPEGRPGNVVDYLLKTAPSPQTLSVLTFWDILQTLLIPVWPKDRTTINGHAIGDAWPLSTLKSQTPSSSQDPSADIQPFHKLTQWLTYSLLVPFQRILDITWTSTSSLTALPEYRNGGLFVDMGVLCLKPSALEAGLLAAKAAGQGGELPLFQAGDDVVVEWRAMTLVLVDRLYGMVRERMQGVDISMAQLLEAGTWKSGREVAGRKRPGTKSSPILIASDGTVF
ncbi:DUF1688-domain-containing protein [Byssothecium circinans]|uniref:DUF1688-domain-containing protein n=1 Tax=Byssothecium circinans TaxID=147558 RepID=A0A6A5TNB4_9PLEO|nr:DUF1688-domain-containing protein [Byssothecium circinans]